MDYQKNYFDDDLKIVLKNQDNPVVIVEDANSDYEDYFRDYYSIAFIKCDSVNVVIDKKVYFFNEPILVLSKPKSKVQWNCSKYPFYYLSINIHPRVFQNMPDIDNVLQFFYKLKGKESVFRIELPQYSNLQICIDFIKAALFAGCGRFTVESRVNTLISELNIIYESKYNEHISSTDSVSVKVMDYIEKHYLEKITLKDISEKFYISYNTINAIVKRFTGNTFKKYIIKLRLDAANLLLKSGNYNIVSAAKLSGFSNYSSFIKIYKKYYGELPSKVKAINRDKNYYPLKVNKKL